MGVLAIQPATGSGGGAEGNRGSSGPVIVQKGRQRRRPERGLLGDGAETELTTTRRAHAEVFADK